MYLISIINQIYLTQVTIISNQAKERQLLDQIFQHWKAPKKMYLHGEQNQVTVSYIEFIDMIVNERNSKK